MKPFVSTGSARIRPGDGVTSAMNRSLIRVAAALFAVVVLAVAAGGGLFWWKIAGLKEEMLQQFQKTIGAQVEVSSLDLDLWNGELKAAGITLTNDRPSAPWKKGDISQATVRFRPLDVFSSTLPVTVDVSSWNIVLLPSVSGAPETPANAAPGGSTEPEQAPSPAKGRVKVTKLSAHEGSVEIDLAGDQKVQIHGVNFEADNNGAGVWTTTLQADSIDAGSLQAGASSVQIRGEQDTITFSNLHVACDQGLVTGDGEMALTTDHHVHLTLKGTEIPLSMLVSAPWQMELVGFVTGDLTYDGQDDSGSAKGQFSVDHAKFKVLPWLGKVTALVSLPDISDVDLDTATTDYTWEKGALHLTNLDVRKNDIVRIGGTVDVDPTGQVDGRLKLGLPSTVTGKWPALQDKIFSVQQDDYNWADVHVTGNSDRLQEDLTSRLVAVTIQQGTEETGTLIDQARQKAADLLKSFLGN
jgi:hypothetical protein